MTKKKDRGEKITGELFPLTEQQLLAAVIDLVRDAEIRLGALGDYLHELRRQMARLRERIETSRNGVH
jgi:hypothetical protein